jgi:hypothetical protein
MAVLLKQSWFAPDAKRNFVCFALVKLWAREGRREGEDSRELPYAPRSRRLLPHSPGASKDDCRQPAPELQEAQDP